MTRPASIGWCDSSIPTVISRRPRSQTTRLRCWPQPGMPAWSECWRPAGTWSRHSPASTSRRRLASTPPWACIRTWRTGSPTWIGASLTSLAPGPEVVAIGETGLDYDRAFSPRDVQLDNLRWHIELAFTVRKPLVLHCRSAPGQRDAQDDLVRELTEAGVGGSAWRDRFGDRPVAVLHSFSGPIDYAEACLSMDCAVSISGLAFRAGEEPTADVARLVPVDRLLVETDSPYLSPPGAPRRRNEPRWVEVTARWVAEQRGVDADALGDDLVDAYDHVFGTG